MAMSFLPFLIVLSSAAVSSGSYIPALPPESQVTKPEVNETQLNETPVTESQVNDTQVNEMQVPESQFTESQITESQFQQGLHSWVNKGTARSFLKAHNELREKYGVPPLRWDRGLARNARHWAYKMHNACSLTHSKTRYGENIFMGEGKWTIREAVEEWAKEKYNYHWKDNSCKPNKMCGHFTQMIWAETQAVGCAKIRCNATFVFMTCNYYPSGNIQGHWPVTNHEQFVSN